MPHGIHDSPPPTPADLFIDRLEVLLRSTPVPLRSTGDEAGFLTSYVDVLLAHRSVAGLLAGYPSAGSAGSTASERARTATEVVHALLAGPGADLEKQVRAAVALAGLNGAVAGCADGQAEAVRSAAVASSVAALRA